MNKVYCINCRYLETTFGDNPVLGGARYKCTDPMNIARVKSIGDTWYEQDSKIEDGIPTPFERNAHNNCVGFKKKRNILIRAIENCLFGA